MTGDGLVVFGGYDGNIYAVSAATGQQQWKVQTGGPVEGAVAIGADGTIYVGSADNNLYAIH